MDSFPRDDRRWPCWSGATEIEGPRPGMRTLLDTPAFMSETDLAVVDDRLAGGLPG